MEIENSIEAQGTIIRVVSAATENATFAQDGVDVTVTLNAHGLKTGDRIQVDTAAGAEFAVGRFTVKSVTANTFTYTADGEDTVAAASALTFKKMYDVEAKTFSGPGGSAAVIDATTLSSTKKRKRMGLADEGQLGFTVYYVPGNPGHETLRAARKARAPAQIEMAYSDTPTTYWAFQGFVLAFPVTGSVDGLIESAVNIEIDGEITEYQDAA
jgi:hypothetical protein